MNLPEAYVDTSAFIKRFLLEAHTEQMEQFIAQGDYRLVLSSLSLIEIKSVLKRKQRENSLGADTARKIAQQVQIELASKALGLHSVDAQTIALAGQLVDSLASPLGTLDAIHLASAKAAKCAMLVSADKQLVKAAHEADLLVLDLS
jgi:predicted nucleic acid-binding protein